MEAIRLIPEEGRLRIEVRGDLAAFLHADVAEHARGSPNKKAALRVQNGCSREVLATLDAGTCSHRQLLIVCRA